MTLISSLAMWFSKNEGTINISWLGWQITTSLSFFIVSILTLLFFSLFSIILLGKIFLLPSNIKKKLERSKIRKARIALNNGVIASAYGEKDLVKKNYILAKKAIKETPMMLLLKLQNQYYSDNHAESFKTLTKMLKYENTRPIGIKGIINIASKNNDLELFSNMLNNAKENSIPVSIIIQECVNFCIRNNNWLDLSAFLDTLSKKNKNLVYNIRGLIDYHIAKDFFVNGEISKAKQYLIRAFETNKTFPPYIELYCRLKLAKSKSYLIKLLKTYWQEFPHPNIEKCLEYGLGIRDLKSNLIVMDEILKKNKKSHVGFLIFGKMKYQAKIWGEAKKDMLKSIQIKPSKQAYLCLVDIEKLFSREEHKIDKWIKLSNQIEDDFKWICSACSHSQIDWNIYCDNCKSFDSLFWKPNNKLEPDLNKKKFSLVSPV